LLGFKLAIAEFRILMNMPAPFYELGLYSFCFLCNQLFDVLCKKRKCNKMAQAKEYFSLFPKLAKKSF